MDSGATLLSPKSKDTPAGIRAAHLLALSVVVLGALAGVRILFSVPKPFLAVIASVFVGCALVFWFVRHRLAGIVLAQMVRLVLAWITVSALLFGTSFWVDGAGWIWFRLTGYNVTLAEDFSDQVDLRVSDFVRRNPEFEVGATENQVVVHGDHVLDRTVVVPRGVELLIEPGTVLRFGRGCSLISYGSVQARGTADAPIRFTARHPLLKWGVVGVVTLNGDNRSNFEHTHFDHGRQARINGIDFPGCLSIIGGAADIRYSSFVDLVGKDAVYVRAGDVLIHDNEFRDTFKDGLDLDGGRGEIRNNRFVDCGDEGIDLSRNEDVRVYDNVILDRRGGRIGADENLAGIRAQNTLGHSKTDDAIERESGVAP